MPHSYGYRAKTRDIFSKDRGTKGQIPLTRYLTNYKVGQYVDIKGDGAVHKGMPHKYYHGKTGIVWNVTKRAVGVIVNKQLRGKILRKKIHVRIEHCKPSNCRKEFLDRCKAGQMAKLNAKNAKEAMPSLKRVPEQPREAYVLSGKEQTVLNLRPSAYTGYRVL